MKEICFQFINVFEGVELFNEDNWFRNSWNQFSRTLILNPQKKNQLPDFKESIKEEVFKHLDEFPHNSKTEIHNSKTEIEDWYKSFLTKDDGFLTLGQRQKLLNILIKYYVVNEFVSNSDKKWSLSLEFLHIPIDSIVLNRFNMNFENIHTHGGKLNGTPWSKIWNYEDYINFQNLVSIESSNVSQSPLEFEMKFLWVSDKELIKFYFQRKIKNREL